MKKSESAGHRKTARLSLHVKPSSGSKKLGDAAADAMLRPSFLQLKEILVPIDFSDGSEKALNYAWKFAEQFGSSVTLLHVIQPMVYPTDFGYPPTVLDPLDEGFHERIEERLEAAARGAPCRIQTLVRVGQPYNEITAAAKELEADLIIIPTHGRTGLKHVFLGSTAERVIRHAPCPVLTVRDRERDFV